MTRLLVLAALLCCPLQHADAITSAQQLLVSSVDHRLPRVSLRFFLEHEAAGATVEWQQAECGRDAAPGRVCVSAVADLPNGRGFSVLVAVEGGAAHLLAVLISDQREAQRRVSLFELPAQLHLGEWPKRRKPRDCCPG
jgi:hypothetical protein